MKTLLIGCTLFALTGCATQTFTMQPGGPDAPTQETKHSFFVSGIGQKKELDAAAVCGGAANVARVETETDVIDNVLGFVTFGIYTPRTARVYCAG